MIVYAAGIGLDTALMTRYSIRLTVGHDGFGLMYVDLDVHYGGDRLSIYIDEGLDFDNASQFAKWMGCIKGRIHHLHRKLELRRRYAHDEIMMWRVPGSELKNGDFVVHPYTFAPFTVVSVGRKAMLLQRLGTDDTLTVRGDDLEMEWPRPSMEAYERLWRIEQRLSRLFWMRPHVHTVYPASGATNNDGMRIG